MNYEWTNLVTFLASVWCARSAIQYRQAAAEDEEWEEKPIYWGSLQHQRFVSSKGNIDLVLTLMFTNVLVGTVQFEETLILYFFAHKNMKKRHSQCKRFQYCPKRPYLPREFKLHMAVFSIFPILGTDLYAAPSSLVLFHRLVVSSSKGQATFEGKYHAPG